MLKEKLDKVMDLIKVKDGQQNSKKKIENLIVFVVILIVTIIIVNVILNGDNEKSKDNERDETKVLASTTTMKESENKEDDLEIKLKNILSKIDGVGKVDVLLTYSESNKVMAMYNEDSTENDTEEQDQQGGNRKISQTSTKKEVIYQEINGEKVPVTQSVSNPKMEGALIIANGANNMQTKTNIVQAVEAVTGLPTHKIQVFEMKN
ncbi:MAG: hypothetical protein J6M60_02205 [Clostridia bacterium]|nr:hypothetical protein [Clostridia bacterium]